MNHEPQKTKRRWAGALKNLLAAQRDVAAYIALSEKTTLGSEECKVIADLYQRRRRPEEALYWVERGLEIARSNTGRSFGEHELREMKRTLLSKLGRSGDALKSAWSEFEEHPSTFRYKELMRYVPAEERKAWHEKAMKASEKGDLSSQIELWMEKKEHDRLAARLREATDEELEGLSHYTTEPSAGKLERSHPAIAARVYRTLCMRIVNAGKSKYYHAALDNLDHAKKCYEKAGLKADWEALVADIRERHSRKSGFMSGFDQIVSEAAKRVEPTFLERAKARWQK